MYVATSREFGGFGPRSSRASAIASGGEHARHVPCVVCLKFLRLRSEVSL